jgi:hypothetical protein
MLFKLTPAPTFKAKVKITAPGGEVAEIEFTFKHKGRKAFDAWARGAAKSESDVAWLDEVIEAWDGPQDSAGEVVPYSRQALDTLLDAYPAASGEITAGYALSLHESRRGN